MKKRNFKIWCNTPEETKEVLTKLDELGFIWADGEKPLTHLKLIGYPVGLCVSSKITYSNKNYKKEFFRDIPEELISIKDLIPDYQVCCSECGQIINNEDYQIVNGKYFCLDCFDDDYCICESCGEIVNRFETYCINDTIYCDNCIDNYTFICSHCGERHSNNNRISDDYISICEDCYDRQFTRCSDCECLINLDYAQYDDDTDEYYCDECWNDRHTYINNYSYKPEPIFYGNSTNELYYGVELEIDGGGEDNRNAEQLHHILNAAKEHCYFKHDGSLNEGFEIVSHPATLDYHMHNIDWSGAMQKALELDYTSHNAETCGLHIHINRQAFGYYPENQEDGISRLVYLVEKFWSELLRFSRRTESQLNQWANRYGLQDWEHIKDVYDKAKGCYNRYVAVNLQPHNTVELRLFRGTLNYNTFIATLQLVDVLCNCALTLNDNTIESLTWYELVDCIPEEYTQLLEYLENKNLM